MTTKITDQRLIHLSAETLAEMRASAPTVEAELSGNPKLKALHDKILADNAATRATASVESSWRDSILASPEARERPRASARLLELYQPGKITVDGARAVLRGLVPETGGSDTLTAPVAASEARNQPSVDAKAARLAELRIGALNFKAGLGDASAKRELRALAAGKV